MDLLKYGGFFRNQNGFNNLPSICELRKILNLSGDFTFEVKRDDIESFCQRGENLKFENFLKVLGDQHMPLIMLFNSDGGQHLTVLQENTIFGSGPDRFVKIKNTDKNEPTIEVRLDMTPNPKRWSLATTKCLYIEFN